MLANSSYLLHLSTSKTIVTLLFAGLNSTMESDFYGGHKLAARMAFFVD
jgi:hypothetical protein